MDKTWMNIKCFPVLKWAGRRCRLHAVHSQSASAHTHRWIITHGFFFQGHSIISWCTVVWSGWRVRLRWVMCQRGSKVKYIFIVPTAMGNFLEMVARPMHFCVACLAGRLRRRRRFVSCTRWTTLVSLLWLRQRTFIRELLQFCFIHSHAKITVFVTL